MAERRWAEQARRVQANLEDLPEKKVLNSQANVLSNFHLGGFGVYQANTQTEEPEKAVEVWGWEWESHTPRLVWEPSQLRAYFCLSYRLTSRTSASVAESIATEAARQVLLVAPALKHMKAEELANQVWQVAVDAVGCRRTKTKCKTFEEAVGAWCPILSSADSA